MNLASSSRPPDPGLLTCFRTGGAHRTALRQQNFLLGFLAGFMAMLAGAGLWAGLSLAAGRQLAVAGLAIGLGVGGAVRFFGRGVEWLFSLVGAGLALLGCLLGVMFTSGLFLAGQQGNIPGMLDPGLRPATLGPLDVLCCLAAAALAWRLSRRRTLVSTNRT